MSSKALNRVLFVILVFMVGTVFLVRRDYTTKNVEFLPGMVSGVAYGPQSANPIFQDRKTLQMPVKGTVARGFEPLLYTPDPEGALRAGLELGSSLDPKDSTGDLARGAFVFNTFCTPCHGSGGAGDGLIPQRGFPPPPSLLAEHAVTMKDGQIFHIITYGQRTMPALAGQVVRDDRWRVVNFIRTLQKHSKPTPLAAQ